MTDRFIAIGNAPVAVSFIRRGKSGATIRVFDAYKQEYVACFQATLKEELAFSKVRTEAEQNVVNALERAGVVPAETRKEAVFAVNTRHVAVTDVARVERAMRGLRAAAIELRRLGGCVVAYGPEELAGASPSLCEEQQIAATNAWLEASWALKLGSA